VGFRRVQALILAGNVPARHVFVAVAEELGIAWCSTVSVGVVDLRLVLLG
jgi:hypothetical protein